MRGGGRVAVVGGGIAGLSAAFELSDGPGEHDVVVFEADDRLGGKLRTSDLGGRPIDEGADAFLTRRPEALDLARRVGLADRLVHPAEGWASVFWHGRRVPLPGDLVLGAPAGVAGVVALARSPLAGPLVAARAAAEPLAAALGRARHRGRDDSLGAEVRRRFGRGVAERLVDPLLGGINAGDTDHLSLRAASPPLAAAAESHRSLLIGLARQRAAAPGGPVFATPLGGTAELVEAVAARLAPRVDVRLGTAVHAVEPSGGGWTVDGERFDAVVLAVPGWVAASLLERVVPAAARGLGAVPYASVAMVTLIVPTVAFAPAPAGSGVLVPEAEQRHITAVSFGSRKWAHWGRPGQEVLRVSVGRDGDEHAFDYDDDTLVRAVLADLADVAGLRGDPAAVRITRWPRSFPQYRPGHLDRIAAAEAALARDAPGLVLAGAALRGLGIPACVGSGRAAAQAVRAHLARVAA